MHRAKFLVLVVFPSFIMTSCNPAKFQTIDETTKNKAISQESIFDTPAGQTNPGIPGSPKEIPLYFVCSDGEANTKGATLLAAKNLKAVIVQYKGILGAGLSAVSTCIEDDLSLVAKIKSSKKLSLSKCSPKGNLITLSRDGATLLSPSPDLNRAVPNDYFTVDLIANGATSLLSTKGEGGSSKVRVLFDINGLIESHFGFKTTIANQSLCDSSASPLFIDMRNEYEKNRKFSLRAPWDGVVFDILGENSDPVPHTPNLISWFENTDMAYITLPDRSGQVKGIDQLFGDNTRGPDGKFAENGYAALAKFDFNKDELITNEDPVYFQLKLWHDRNHDGRADSAELVSLSDSQIAVIDLRFDSSFSEQDIYGNTIKYKSVAKMNNGEYRLVFDIWFELNLHKARLRYLDRSR